LRQLHLPPSPRFSYSVFTTPIPVPSVSNPPSSMSHPFYWEPSWGNLLRGRCISVGNRKGSIFTWRCLRSSSCSQVSSFSHSTRRSYRYFRTINQGISPSESCLRVCRPLRSRPVSFPHISQNPISHTEPWPSHYLPQNPIPIGGIRKRGRPGSIL